MAIPRLTPLTATILILVLSVAVQAQFGGGFFGGNNGGNGGGFFGGGGGGRQQDPDDDVPWWQQGQQPRNQPQPRPTQIPRQPQQPQQGYPFGNQGGYNPFNPQPQQNPYNQGPYGGYNNPFQPRPTQTPTRTQPGQPGRPTITYQPTPYGQPPPYDDSTRTNTWSQPSAWGPPRSPFGPISTPTGPQTIPTTTTEAPRPNVPFLTVCGGMKYVEDDVSNALIAGCFYKNKTQTVNKSEYPKIFDNPRRGNFNFGDVLGPYWEFPLISSAAYIGGNPGPDRVVFNNACFLAGEVTETNAGARGLTECKETY